MLDHKVIQYFSLFSAISIWSLEAQVKLSLIKHCFKSLNPYFLKRVYN